jgi:hypothetical protein
MPIASEPLLLARYLPSLFCAEALHRAGLELMSHGRSAAADELFERAVAGYRRSLAVEPLARLRVHQLMARVRAGRVPDRENAILEIERRLAGLSRIESLRRPFALVPAASLLATWLAVSDRETAAEPLAA